MAMIFGLPPEVLDQILERLDQRSIVHLSLTCKDAASSAVFDKHLYRTLFDRHDLPIGTFKDFCEAQQPQLQRLVNGLNERTGLMVKHMTMPQYMTTAILTKIAQQCSNPGSIDFTGILEVRQPALNVCSQQPVNV